MSRYRQIHCLIWNDDKFPFLSDDTKLVFFHLLTTPFSTPFGLFKASIGALADEIRWSPKRYEKAIKDAIAHGMIEYDPKAYLIFIPNFLKYNWPTSKNQVKSWKRIFDELPNSPLKIKFLQKLKALTDGKTDGISYAIKDVFALASLIQEQEQEQDIYNNITNTPNGVFPRSCDDTSEASPDSANKGNGKDKEEKIFITIPLTPSQGEYAVREELVEQLQELYPAVDVREELRKLKAWNIANPKRRKTKSGIKRHIITWLSRAQDSAKNARASPAVDDPKAIAERIRKLREQQGVKDD